MISMPINDSIAHAPGAAQRPLYQHRSLILIVLAYAAIALAVNRHYPMRENTGTLLIGYASTAIVIPLFALCGYLLFVMLALRPVHLSRFLLEGARLHLHRQRLLHALPVLLLMPLFASSFTILRVAIPLIHPYAWDSRLAAWDLLLHGGVQPWHWLQGLLAHPLLTAIVNYLYHLWFFVMFAVLGLLTFSMARPQLRMQFLLSFVLSWILLGTVLATLCSSVGPCYYGYLVPGHDPYAPLMSYLHSADARIPILALDVQAMLWDGYQDKAYSAKLGISAMPSMHVATAVLLALWGWQCGRRAGIALTLFALAIMVGSVHLGWHYALDGYVGAAGAYVIWRTVGALLAREHSHDR